MDTQPKTFNQIVNNNYPIYMVVILHIIIMVFAGYIAEVHLQMAYPIAPTEFGEFDEDTGIWKPKAYTG